MNKPNNNTPLRKKKLIAAAELMVGYHYTSKIKASGSKTSSLEGTSLVICHY